MSTAPDVDLVCYSCGSHYDAGARCGCGEPLWRDTDPRDFGWDDIADTPGMWRYAPLFSVSSPGGVADAAGGTPLVRTRSLDDYAGARTHLKDEGENPTGSFKDRGSALGVAAALEDGPDAVGTVSHGNMAMSTAAHAASAAMPCVVLVPTDIPEERLAHIAQYDPTLLRVDGDYGRLYERTLELGAELGVAFLNSDVPSRVEGQKTTALEICEAFAPEVPDAVVLPVSSGGHLSGVWKGLLELRTSDAVGRLPRLYGVQAATCAPIAAAFGSDAGEVSPVAGGETVAYSIANADPPSGNRALAAVRETGGAVVSMTDDELLAAKAAFARRAGFAVETSSAATLAGAKRLAERSEIGPDDDVVLVATGSGLKERPDEPSAGRPETVTLGDLDERLADVVGRG